MHVTFSKNSGVSRHRQINAHQIAQRNRNLATPQPEESAEYHQDLRG